MKSSNVDDPSLDKNDLLKQLQMVAFTSKVLKGFYRVVFSVGYAALLKSPNDYFSRDNTVLSLITYGKRNGTFKTNLFGVLDKKTLRPQPGIEPGLIDLASNALPTK